MIPREDELATAALAAREKAYAPYSGFLVGAALLDADGRVSLGCNVENASYGLCLCAERSAVAAAIQTGARAFTAIAIATASDPPSPPCGLCRQTLAEFGPDLDILLVNTAGTRVRTRLGTLFPGGFNATLLASGTSTSGTNG